MEIVNETSPQQDSADATPQICIQTAQDTTPPQGPTPPLAQTPDGAPPDVPQGPDSDATLCTNQQKQDRVPARPRGTQNKALVAASKSKRKRTSIIDCEQVLADVQQDFMEDTIKPPPLAHTPHSMFEMLCHAFEQEFPNRLPQAVVEQFLLSLKED